MVNCFIALLKGIVLFPFAVSLVFVGILLVLPSIPFFLAELGGCDGAAERSPFIWWTERIDNWVP